MVANELAQALHGEDDLTVGEIRSWFESPDAVMLVAERPGGRIAGYADFLDQSQEHLRFPVDLRVPPGADDARAIASALLDTVESQVAPVALPGASIRVHFHSTNEELRRLVEDRGYDPYRYSFQMRIDFDGELPAPVWPDGISVRTIDPGREDEAVYRAHDDAFTDHFEHAQWPYESWRAWAFGESFDPSLWWLAVDGDEIAGVCFGRAEGGPGGELGWVNVLGVRPPWRRRGLGRALLLHAFADFRARGKRGAGLGVDGLNPTGAVRLYEQAGMHVARRIDQYKKPLRP